MEFKAARSFIDPLSGKAYQIGEAYHSSDDEHSSYLLKHELISYAVPPATVESTPITDIDGGDNPAEDGDTGGEDPDVNGSAVEPEHETVEAGEGEEVVIDEKPKRSRKRGTGDGAD